MIETRELTLEEKLAVYQLPVGIKNAARGVRKYEMLLWYEYNQGMNAIVAPSRTSVLNVWERTLDKIRPDLVEYWQLEVVLPPYEALVNYAEHAYENDFSAFKDGLVFRIGDYLERHGRIPEGISTCPEYRPDPKVYEPEMISALSGWEKERHLHCLNNCLEGYLLNDKLRKLWLLVQGSGLKRFEHFCNRSVWQKANRQVEIGPRFSPERMLHALCLDGGHHCLGLNVQTVDAEWLKHPRSNVCFFFHGCKIEPPEEAVTILKTRIEKREAVEQNEVALRERQHEAEEREQDMVLEHLLSLEVQL